LTNGSPCELFARQQGSWGLNYYTRHRNALHKMQFWRLQNVESHWKRLITWSMQYILYTYTSSHNINISFFNHVTMWNVELNFFQCKVFEWKVMNFKNECSSFYLQVIKVILFFTGMHAKNCIDFYSVIYTINPRLQNMYNIISLQVENSLYVYVCLLLDMYLLCNKRIFNGKNINSLCIA